MIQANKLAFDDYTPLEWDEFEKVTLGANSASWEIGDGVGLTTLIFDEDNAYVQMVMYDWRFRVDACQTLIANAWELGALRMTSLVTEDRDVARDLITGLGFQREGTFRKAFLRAERYLDVEVYGLLRP